MCCPCVCQVRKVGCSLPPSSSCWHPFPAAGCVDSGQNPQSNQTFELGVPMRSLAGPAIVVGNLAVLSATTTAVDTQACGNGEQAAAALRGRNSFEDTLRRPTTTSECALNVGWRWLQRQHAGAADLPMSCRSLPCFLTPVGGCNTQQGEGRGTVCSEQQPQEQQQRRPRRRERAIDNSGRYGRGQQLVGPTVIAGKRELCLPSRQSLQMHR